LPPTPLVVSSGKLFSLPTVGPFGGPKYNNNYKPLFLFSFVKFLVEVFDISQ